jgi:hypothetical protein
MGAEATLGQLNSAIDKIETFPSQMTEALNGLQDKVNSVLSSVPGWLGDIIHWIVDKAKWLWDHIVQLAEQVFDWLKENVWPVIRGPITLYETSNKWTTDVFHNSSTVSGDVNLAKTKVDDWWQGAGATAYTQIITPQKAASDKVGEIANKVKDTLQTLAISLGILYIGLAAVLVWALLQIPVIAGLITSVIGIPAGLLDAVATFLLLLGGAAALVAAGTAIAKDGISAFGTLLQLKNDNTAFENGHWPKDAAALGEIGNGSNWHFKG